MKGKEKEKSKELVKKIHVMTLVFWFLNSGALFPFPHLWCHFPSPSQFWKYSYLILPFYAPHPQYSFSNPDRAIQCLGEEPVYQLNVSKFYLSCWQVGRHFASCLLF